MHDIITKKIIRIFIVVFIIALIATIVGLLILKYSVEGENNMPFELSKIMVISSVSGIDILENQTEPKLEVNLVQNNDVYLEISKNKNYKSTEIIDKIIIDNLQIEKDPSIGKVKLYKPTIKEKPLYENIEENEIKNSLEYTGKEVSSVKNAEIANQGGLILFRYAIEDLGKYTETSTEAKYDGTILKKQNIEHKDLECKVCFDLSIKLKSDIIYTGTVKLDLPVGNIVEEGISHYERTDLTDIIFKRNLR